MRLNFLRSFYTRVAKCSYSKMTYYGNQPVAAEIRTQMVDSMFSKVASNYDLMNDIMSLGTHRLIKKYFLRNLHPTSNIKLLDVACGTGDIGLTFLRSMKEDKSEPEILQDFNNPFTEEQSTVPQKSEAHVVLLDMNENMLSICQERAKSFGLQNDVACIVGSAEALPFPDNTFDAYTIAFGIRNVTLIDQALLEAKRVLKKHGRFLCLEFSHVENPIISRFYSIYRESFPCLGQLVVGDWKSYQYLNESIQRFPVQEEFQHQIEDAGFVCATYENIFNGVVAIHSAFKQ